MCRVGFAFLCAFSVVHTAILPSWCGAPPVSQIAGCLIRVCPQYNIQHTMHNQPRTRAPTLTVPMRGCADPDPARCGGGFLQYSHAPYISAGMGCSLGALPRAPHCSTRRYPLGSLTCSLERGTRPTTHDIRQRVSLEGSIWEGQFGRVSLAGSV